jgi:hypothetical protein
MNYRDEVTAFNGQLEAGTLSACEIALWHALHDVGIQCGHSDGLSLATVTLTARTGFSASSIKRARDSLRDKGYIRYTSRGSNRAAVYEIRSVVQGEPQREPQREPQDGPQGGPQRGPRDGPLYTTTTKNVDVDISAHPEPQDEPQREPHTDVWLSDAEMAEAREKHADNEKLFQQAIDLGIPFDSRGYDTFCALVAEYTAEWVSAAIDKMAGAPASARAWRYLRGTLNGFRRDGRLEGHKTPSEEHIRKKLLEERRTELIIAGRHVEAAGLTMDEIGKVGQV